MSKSRGSFFVFYTLQYKYKILLKFYDMITFTTALNNNDSVIPFLFDKIFTVKFEITLTLSHSFNNFFFNINTTCM